MHPSLGLAYARHIDDQSLHALEQAARRTGLPLSHVELLGQRRTVIQAFLDAVERHDVPAFLASVDWDALETCLEENVAALRVQVSR